MCDVRNRFTWYVWCVGTRGTLGVRGPCVGHVVYMEDVWYTIQGVIYTYCLRGLSVCLLHTLL